MCFKSAGLISLFLLAHLTSCGYQRGYGSVLEGYRTITVPYAQEDQQGLLTAEVIKQISIRGVATYQTHDGDVILKIKLLEFRDEPIGFRYDHNKHNELKHTIIPSETRIHALAEVSLVEAATNQVIKGPVRVAASVDFDHDYYKSWRSDNIYSLGQLNDIDAAHDAVMLPLNRRLAEKIVDWVINSW